MVALKPAGVPLPRAIASLIVAGCVAVLFVEFSDYRLGLSAALYSPGAGGSSGTAAAQHVAAGAARQLVLPTSFAGVRHWAIPGELLRSPLAPDPRAGVLHLYLKALRWPDGHLRIKGFAAFDTVAPPVRRENYTFAHVPEVYRHLRLGLRSASGGWERKVALEYPFNRCELQSRSPGFDYAACLAAEKAKQWAQYPIPDISIDLGATSDTDYELFIYGWPRHVDLAAQLQEALARPPLRPFPPRPPSLYRALPYLSTIHPTRVARILRWSNQYHAAVGLRGALLYVLSKDVAALESNPVIGMLVAARRLTLVLWDDFAWLRQWRDFDLQVVESHAVLSMWGQHARALVMDLDEFFVPAKAGDRLPAMLSQGCLARLRPECLYFSRYNIFPHDGSGEPVVEPPLWRQQGPNPLRRYRWRSPQTSPKALVDGSRVLPMSVHFTAICSGTSEVADGSSTGKLRHCPSYPVIARIWRILDVVYFELKPPYTTIHTQYKIAGSRLPNGGTPILILGRGSPLENGNLLFSIAPPNFRAGKYLFQASSVSSCGESEYGNPKKFTMPIPLPGKTTIRSLSVKARPLCSQLTPKLFYSTGCSVIDVLFKPPPKLINAWLNFKVRCTLEACPSPCACSGAGKKSAAGGAPMHLLPPCERVWTTEGPGVSAAGGLRRLRVPFVAVDSNVIYKCEVTAYNVIGDGPTSPAARVVLPFGPPTLNPPGITAATVSSSNKLTVVVAPVDGSVSGYLVTVAPVGGKGTILVRSGAGTRTSNGIEFYFTPADGLLWDTTYDVSVSYVNGKYGSSYFLVGSRLPPTRVKTPIDPRTLPSIDSISFKDRAQCSQLSWDEFEKSGCAEVVVIVNRPELLTTDMPSGMYKVVCLPQGCAAEPPNSRRRLLYDVPPPCERMLRVIGEGASTGNTDGRRLFRLPFVPLDANVEHRCYVQMRYTEGFGPASAIKTAAVPYGPPATGSAAGTPTIYSITANAAGRLAVAITTYRSGPYLLVGKPADGAVGAEIRMPWASGATGYVTSDMYTGGVLYDFTVAYVTGEYGSSYYFIGVESPVKQFKTPA
ncbi:sidekick isoform X1 [Micractinium conductrix]|uniref:Sidekick isoform X1 n=1 Tax=Micractinium conductrix TaxID=554055 RepID=A0A2P6V979_9CHLO|nr:sidekick isoform X1 [Micractinium conductrix]|eukprot:PSC70646.1 sidekick isoform X1 [Micractinium conductrix]